MEAGYYKSKEYRREWRARNKEELLANFRKYRAENKERLDANQKKWRKLNPDKVWANRLKTVYGMTLAQYNELLLKQGSKCALCGARKSHKGSRLALDHDHETGAIRGLLCSRCNTSLGWYEKVAKLLPEYLERSCGISKR